jgi:predicted enzyme related to lactoylglutathione lyase
MGTRTEHAPGTFSWVDLTTNDAAGAKEFYGGMFGWEPEDNEIPEEAGGGTYTMFKLGGEYVAAIGQETEEFPPHWNSYVTVTSADDASAKAGELGANVIEQPFDVLEAGGHVGRLLHKRRARSQRARRVVACESRPTWLRARWPRSGGRRPRRSRSGRRRHRRGSR